MGRRGPAPTPQAVKDAMAYSWASTGDEEGQAPYPPFEIPDKPENIVADEIASREWDKISKRLYELNLLTNLDYTQLDLYCSLYSQWARACADVRKYGIIIADKKGRVGLNPAIRASNQLAGQLANCLKKFGMNPTDRSRLRVLPRRTATPPKPANDDEQETTEGTIDFFNHLDNPNTINQQRRAIPQSPGGAEPQEAGEEEQAAQG